MHNIIKKQYIAGVLCLFVAIQSSVLAGSIEGTISYKGKPRPAKTIKTSADPICSATHKTLKDEKFVVGEGTDGVYPLANIFVYVKSGHAKKAYPVPSEPLVIDQKGCTYVPHVSGARVGQKIEFKNSDPTMHNVHSLGKNSPPFNRGMPAGSPNANYSFKESEVMVKIKCDAHPWMSCYVGVLDHPFYAVTGKDGKFSITGLEDGTYNVETWQELLGLKTGTVTVASGTGTLNIEYTRNKK
jgi:plastocyanin